MIDEGQLIWKVLHEGRRAWNIALSYIFYVIHLCPQRVTYFVVTLHGTAIGNVPALDKSNHYYDKKCKYGRLVRRTVFVVAVLSKQVPNQDLRSQPWWNID